MHHGILLKLSQQDPPGSKGTSATIIDDVALSTFKGFPLPCVNEGDVISFVRSSVHYDALCSVRHQTFIFPLSFFILFGAFLVLFALTCALIMICILICAGPGADGEREKTMRVDWSQPASKRIHVVVRVRYLKLSLVNIWNYLNIQRIQKHI